tara:strand:- start:4151 stop:4303 length:153 start_codon:yes stop_codon:yes gene_type:complete
MHFDHRSMRRHVPARTTDKVRPACPVSRQNCEKTGETADERPWFTGESAI